MDTLRIKSNSFTCLDGVGASSKIFMLEEMDNVVKLLLSLQNGNRQDCSHFFEIDNSVK